METVPSGLIIMEIANGWADMHSLLSHVNRRQALRLRSQHVNEGIPALRLVEEHIDHPIQHLLRRHRILRLILVHRVARHVHVEPGTKRDGRSAHFLATIAELERHGERDVGAGRGDVRGRNARFEQEGVCVERVVERRGPAVRGRLPLVYAERVAARCFG